MRDYIKLTSRLTIICVVAALLLALTYQVTKQPIADQELAAATKARQEIMPKASEFAKMAFPVDEQFKVVKAIYAAVEGTNTIGYAVEVSVSGYGGNIPLSVGIATDGTITGVRIGANQETAGLGSKCTSPDFYLQYDNKPAPLTVKKEIQPISGATITSEAVTLGVNLAAEFVAKHSGSLTPDVSEVK